MENQDKAIGEFREIVDKYNNIVFFGGAGVSTESGIPDFRSVDGLYNQQYDYPPETFSVIPFIAETLKNFIGFTATKCFLQMPSQMPHI